MVKAVAALQQQVRQLELADTQQWTALDMLRDRLPNWVVLVLTGGSAIIGALAHWLASCLK